MIREYVDSARRFTRNARLFLAGTFFFGFGFGTLWVLLNLHLREIGFDDAWIGRILSAQAVGTVLAAIGVATFARRHVLKPLLIAAAIGHAGGIAILAFGRSPVVLLPAAVLVGASYTVHMVTAAPFFMRNSTPVERIYLFGVSWAVEIVASVLGTALSGWVAHAAAGVFGSLHLGYRTALVGAGIAVLAAVIPYAMIRPTPPTPAEGTRVAAGRGSRLLVKLIVPAFIVGAGAGLIVPFLNLYFRDRFGRSPESIGAIFAVGQILTAVGYLAGPVIARRIGMIRTVVAAEISSIPFFLLMAFTTSLPLGMVAFWLRGTLMNMNHPVATNFAMEAVGEERHAFTNSVLMLSWNLSWMVSTQVGGILIDRHGFTTPMVITSLMYLVSSSLYLTFFDRFERSLGLGGRAAVAGGGRP